MTWIAQECILDLFMIATHGHAGLIRPLPAVVFPIEEAPDALRQLSAAKHIGKVVVEVPGLLPAPRGAQGRWIVSGGLGALGTLSVQWLASQGVHTYAGVSGHSPRVLSHHKELWLLWSHEILAFQVFRETEVGSTDGRNHGSVFSAEHCLKSGLSM